MRQERTQADVQQVLGQLVAPDDELGALTGRLVNFLTGRGQVLQDTRGSQGVGVTKSSGLQSGPQHRARLVKRW